VGVICTVDLPDSLSSRGFCAGPSVSIPYLVARIDKGNFDGVGLMVV
jgi:hypothetical protein